MRTALTALLATLVCLVAASSASAINYYVAAPGATGTCGNELEKEGKACGSETLKWATVQDAASQVKNREGEYTTLIYIEGQHEESVTTTVPGEKGHTITYVSTDGGGLHELNINTSHILAEKLHTCTSEGIALTSVTFYENTDTCGWLGLNGNYVGHSAGGTISSFANTTVKAWWSRGGNDALTPEAGTELSKSAELAADLKGEEEAGMKPVITITYEGYNELAKPNKPDPTFPGKEAKTAEHYAKEFVKTAESILEVYPNVVLEPMNEPWFNTYPTEDDGEQYGEILAKLMPELAKAKIPANKVFVASYGEDEWVEDIYKASEALKTEIAGWYYHCDGGKTGECTKSGENGGGIQQTGRSEMKSGKDNIILSEFGERMGSSKTEKEEYPAKEAEFKEVLKVANEDHAEGEKWLTAAIVYSRNAKEWNMSEAGKPGNVTADGKIFTEFAEEHG
jgi:hypothetical protein